MLTDKHIYKELFLFFDSCPTIEFLIDFNVTYLILHYVMYKVLLLNQNFRSVSYDKQTCILINLMEGLLLGFMRYCYKT